MAETGKASPQFWSMGSTNRKSSNPQERLKSLIDQAQALLHAGKQGEAMRAAQEALQIADIAITRVALAAINLVRGDVKEAEANYRKALSHNPRHITALLGLGQLKLNSGKAPAAIQVLQAALDVSPGNLDARHLLARAYGLSKRYEEARKLFEALIAERPQAADIWLGYAHALSALGEVDGAVTAYRRALKLNPNDHRLQLLVAEGFLSVGKVDSAERHFRQAIKLRPDFGPPYHHLARMKRLTDEELEEARRQLSNITPGDQKRIPFLAAIAQVGEQKGDAALAFSALSEALELRKKNRRAGYDRDAAARKIEGAIAQIGVSPPLALPISRPRPVFIIGMPRSGSTLIEQILERHPHVYASGEWPAMRRVASSMSNLDKSFPEGLSSLKDDEIRDLRAAYFQGLDPEAEGKLAMTDKQLGNFIYLPLIERLFPEAKIIRCRRHPMDICWSILTQLFGDQVSFGLSVEDIAHQMHQQHRVFSVWSERGTLPVLEVFNEELVERFEDGARTMVTFADLEWDDACLTPQGSSRAVLTASAGQVHRSISKSSIGRWKPFASYLADAQAALKPLIEIHEAELAKRGIVYG
ncbi:MAG TPA: sulfotransferase [Aestuariivirgaceae bacterium]